MSFNYYLWVKSVSFMLLIRFVAYQLELNLDLQLALLSCYSILHGF